MSYLVLARKYRPQVFGSLLSQDFIVQTLENAIKMGRVSHAYLFTGPRGVGKTSSARIFAKALNCLTPEGINPCNKCDNCLDINNGTSLDVIEIDGASNRGVEEIRSLREAVRFIPVRSKYKIYIIDEVHMLTKEAFNALLKTLEEPPEFVIFIFATTEYNKIAPTILSRCQRYDFKRITYKDMHDNIVDILQKESIKFDEDAVSLVIRKSDGCMRDSLSLLDQVIAFTNGDVNIKDTAFLLGVSDSYIADEIFTAVLKEDTDLVVSLVKKVDEQGIDYRYITECLIERVRNMLHLTLANKLPNDDFTSVELEFYNGLKKVSSHHRLYALFQIFMKLLEDIKYFDFHKYIFEFAMLKGATLSQIIPFKEGVKFNIEASRETVALVKEEAIDIDVKKKS